MNTLAQRITSSLMAAVVFFSFSLPVLADSFDAQIQALNSSIADSRSHINQLAGQADTLSNKIAVLNNQIDAISSQLELDQLKMDKLNAHIAQVEAELATQKTNLSATVRTVYVGGQASSFELMMASDSIGEYLDKQAFTERVNDRIQEGIKKIASLESTLKQQQAELQNLLDTQKAQQQALASTRAEQAQLLADTQNEEANYQNLVASNKQKLDAIYSERARLDALNHVNVQTGGTGGYPWANVVPDSGSDPWGGLYRECVSYVAWKRRDVGIAPYPLYWGNAKDWIVHTDSSSPTPGAIAVFSPGVGGAGGVGHVAYVERVNGNGTMDISEYNWRPYVYTYRAGVSTSGVRFVR